MANLNSIKQGTFGQVQRQQYYSSNLLGLTAHERHLKFVNDYVRFYGDGALPQAPAVPVRTDLDSLKDTYRFLRTEEDNHGDSEDVRLAKKYYDRLFKEYCIADLSRYKESKLGLRWRTHKEVLSGKGQFVCGAKGCEEKDGLCSYEVNFGYSEAGTRKQALVKLRLCPSCAYKLNYKKEKQFQKATGGKRRRDDVVAPAKATKAAPDDRTGICDEGIERAAGYIVPPPQKLASDEASQQQVVGHNIVLPADNTIWDTKPVLEATADEEFDQYFEGLFM